MGEETADSNVGPAAVTDNEGDRIAQYLMRVQRRLRGYLGDGVNVFEMVVTGSAVVLLDRTLWKDLWDDCILTLIFVVGSVFAR